MVQLISRFINKINSGLVNRFNFILLSLSCFLLLSCFTSYCHAIEIKSVKVPENVVIGNESLTLQGAALRTKLIIDVYVGAFYAKGKLDTPEQALKAPGAKRMWFYFLREIDVATFKQTWREGLQSNNSEEDIKNRKNLMNKFIDLIDKDLSNGDIMTVDYIPGVGTQLSINGKLKGTIEDEHFYPMVLNVWMGGHPPSLKFQKALLNLN